MFSRNDQRTRDFSEWFRGLRNQKGQLGNGLQYSPDSDSHMAPYFSSAPVFSRASSVSSRASFGSTDSGVSHPPRAKRKGKKIVQAKYSGLFSASAENVAKFDCYDAHPTTPDAKKRKFEEVAVSKCAPQIQTKLFASSVDFYPELKEALASPVDRPFLLLLEKDFVDFICNSKQEYMDLPQNCLPHQKLLFFKLADYYHVTYGDHGSWVRIFQPVPSCGIPIPIAALVGSDTDQIETLSNTSSEDFIDTHSLCEGGAARLMISPGNEAMLFERKGNRLNYTQYRIDYFKEL